MTDVTENDNWDVEADVTLTPEQQQQFLSDTRSMILKLNELKKLLSAAGTDVILGAEEQDNFSPNLITITPEQQQQFLSDTRNMILKLNELKELLSDVGTSFSITPETPNNLSTPSDMGLMALTPELQQQLLSDTQSMFLKLTELKQLLSDFDFKMNVTLKPEEQSNFSMTSMGSITMTPQQQEEFFSEIQSITLKLKELKQLLSNSGMSVISKPEEQDDFSTTGMGLMTLQPDTASVSLKPHEQLHPDADSDVISSHEEQGQFLLDTPSVTLKPNERKKTFTDTEMDEILRADQQDDFLTDEDLVTLMPNELAHSDADIDATLRPEHQEQTLSNCLKKSHELVDPDAEINATLRLEDQHQEQSLFDCLNGTPKPQLFHPDNEIDATLRLEEEQRQDVTPKAHGLLYPDADMDVILTHEDQGQFLSDPLSVTLKSPNEMKQMFSDTKMDETLRADQQVDFFLTDEDLETLKPHEIIHSGADTDTTLRLDKLEQSLSDSLKKPHERAPDDEIDAILRLEEEHQEQTISDSLNVTLRPNKLFHSDADLDVTSTHEEQVQFLLSDTLSVTLRPNEMKQTFSDTEMDDTLRDDQQDDFLIDEGLVTLRPHEIVHPDAVDATLRPEQQEQSLSATMNVIPHELLLPDTQTNMTMTHEQKEQFSPSDYKSTTLRSDQQKEIFPSSNRVRTELQEQCLCDNLSATTFRPYQLKEVLQDSEIEIMTPDQKEQFLSQGERDQLLCDSETEKERDDFPTTAKVLMTFSSGKQEEFPSDTTRMALTGTKTEELHYLIVHDDIEMDSFCINGDAENQGNMEMGNTIYMSTEGPLETKGPYV